ncbi:MAG: DUF5063 domain-containing protein, partial [Myxococcota bacterium]
MANQKRCGRAKRPFPSGEVPECERGGWGVRFLNMVRKRKDEGRSVPEHHPPLQPGKHAMLSNETQHFLDCIREYEAVLRNRADTTSAQTIRRLIRALCRLIDAATELPHLEREDDKADFYQLEKPEPPIKQIRALIVEDLSFQMYWTCWPDLDEPAQTVVGDIVDDLGDIWSDLHRGLEMLEVDWDTSEAYAVHHWRSMFRSH